MPTANEHGCLIRKLRSQCPLCTLSDSDFKTLSYPAQECHSNTAAQKKCRKEWKAGVELGGVIPRNPVLLGCFCGKACDSSRARAWTCWQKWFWVQLPRLSASGSFILVGFLFPPVLRPIISKWRALSIRQKFTPRLPSVTGTPEIPRRPCHCVWQKDGMTLCLRVAWYLRCLQGFPLSAFPGQTGKQAAWECAN